MSMTFERLVADVDAFVDAAVEKSKDGLTVAEFSELAFALLRLVIVAVDAMPEDGSTKKTWALDAVGLLFDRIAARAVPVFLLPVWIVCKPALKKLCIMAASGAIEQILPLLRSMR